MVKGLREWIQWIDDHGIKKCAVTNAPKKNAEVMLEALGLECASCPVSDSAVQDLHYFPVPPGHPDCVQGCPEQTSCVT